MLWQDKLSLLPFLLKDEEKFNKNWHWPSSKTEKVLLVAKSSNCWNKRSSQPQSSARGGKATGQPLGQPRVGPVPALERVGGSRPCMQLQDIVRSQMQGAPNDIDLCEGD